MRTDGVEAPVGPVLGGPQRSGDRARIGAVVVIAALMLGAGIGLAGNGLTSPPTTLPPSPSPPSGAVASPVPTSTRIPSLPPPTQNAGLRCAPVRFGAPPEIRLGIGPGDPLAIRGVLPAILPGGPGSPSPTWPVPPVDGVLRVSARTSIQLIADQDACMRYVITEYVPGAPGLTVPFPIAFRTLNVNPPRSIVPLGMLPVGDWIVRVVVYFSTGTVGQDGTFVERFFRVANSETAVPIPTPVASPRVPCAAPPAGGVAPTLALSVPTGDPVAGTPGLVVPPVTPVRLGDLIEIRVAGDACAIGWVIGATQPNVNNQYELEREDNPGNNPFLFVQNRWRLHDLPTGLLFVSATIRFSADASVTSRWLLDVRGLDVPGARILAPNRAVTAVRTACGASWSFEDATGGYEYCAAEPLPSSLPTLTVAPETPLRVEVPGWTIIGWNGVCGRSDELNSPDVPFLAVDGCDLGGRYPADASASPVRAVFLPRASGPLVRIWLIATRGGETVSWAVYVRIATGS